MKVLIPLELSVLYPNAKLFLTNIGIKCRVTLRIPNEMDTSHLDEMYGSFVSKKNGWKYITYEGFVNQELVTTAGIKFWIDTVMDSLKIEARKLKILQLDREIEEIADIQARR